VLIFYILPISPPFRLQHLTLSEKRHHAEEWLTVHAQCHGYIDTLHLAPLVPRWRARALCLHSEVLVIFRAACIAYRILPDLVPSADGGVKWMESAGAKLSYVCTYVDDIDVCDHNVQLESSVGMDERKGRWDRKEIHNAESEKIKLRL
jgi:hypothetical protein